MTDKREVETKDAKPEQEAEQEAKTSVLDPEAMYEARSPVYNGSTQILTALKRYSGKELIDCDLSENELRGCIARKALVKVKK